MDKKRIIEKTVKKTAFLILLSLSITNSVIFIFKPVVLRGLIMGNFIAFFISLIVGIVFISKIERNTDRIHTLNRELETMASIDYLTGLYNRRKLIESASALIEISKRYSHTLSCCLFDIDDFKIINDTDGHPEGDRLLIRIGDILKKTLRHSDIAGRFGGDEFYILLPETETEQAVNAVEKIKDEIYSITTVSGRRATCSFGIKTYSGKEIPDINIILKETDIALYSAKKLGKNRIFSL